MLLKIWVTSDPLRLLRNTVSVCILYILAMHKLHTIMITIKIMGEILLAHKLEEQIIHSTTIDDMLLIHVFSGLRLIS